MRENAKAPRLTTAHTYGPSQQVRHTSPRSSRHPGCFGTKESWVRTRGMEAPQNIQCQAVPERLRAGPRAWE